MSSDYESVLLVKPEVFVYRIPPRPGARGYRADEWKLDQPDWTGRLKVVAKGKSLNIRLEDKVTGELFATAPVDAHPSVAVEAVLDSSRYFVLRLVNENGQTAFIGIGFQDRGDAFDLNVALQDHFKWLRHEEEAVEATKELQEGPKLDLGFKEGQTIKINLNTRRAGDEGAKSSPRSRPKASGGGLGLLPPPPGSSSGAGGRPRGSGPSRSSDAFAAAAAPSSDLLSLGVAPSPQQHPASSSGGTEWTAFE